MNQAGGVGNYRVALVALDDSGDVTLPTDILVLHDIEGQSHEQCAEILGCRIGTSKSQLHKARARMRELLSSSLQPRVAPASDQAKVEEG